MKRYFRYNLAIDSRYDEYQQMYQNWLEYWIERFADEFNVVSDFAYKYISASPLAGKAFYEFLKENNLDVEWYELPNVPVANYDAFSIYGIKVSHQHITENHKSISSKPILRVIK